MKNLTLKKLESLEPCRDGLDWYKACGETDLRKICERLLVDNRSNWAHWVIIRLMTKKQKVQYAVFAAKQVIEIFEKKYPSDRRPREAIDAAKKWIRSPTAKNKKASAAAEADADDAAAAADDAADDAADAYDAADTYDAAAYTAAAYAAAAAAAAAYTAAADADDDAADAAYDAAASAAAAAAAAAAASSSAAADARAEMQKRIVEYGLRLLVGKRTN